MAGDLRYQFERLGVLGKLILINLVVFILDGLITFLFKLSDDTILDWFWLPKDIMEFIGQPWSIVTYSFFHLDFMHILFNMIMLYIFGRMLLDLFGPKRFINVYFLGVIFGGLFFMLSYNIFPVFLDVPRAGVMGASAGVMAVVIYMCAYYPNREVRIVFFNLKLWYIGVFFVALDLAMISTGQNAGGRFSHLGGALLGYLYAKQSAKGNDIGSGFSNFLDGIGNMFKRQEKKAPMKTVYRKKNVW